MGDAMNMTDDSKVENMEKKNDDAPQGPTPKELISKKLAEDNFNILLTLKNGKCVSLADCGDPNGIPVMFFIGLAGTRHFAYVFGDIARENGIRLICPDRPGTGRSDDVDHADKTPLKWTETASEIADQLNIEKFGILAQSCGAVYALAYAMTFPQRLLGRIHLVSPWVPLGAPGVSKGLKFAQYMPRFVLSASSSFIQSMPQVVVSMGSVNAISSGWSAAERKSFTENRIADFFEVMLNIKKNENYTGHKNDFLMSLEKDHPIGFEYHHVKYPVHIFHGNKDGMVPLAAAKGIEASMPDCKLSIRDMATHNLAMDLEYCKETIFPSLKSSLDGSGV